MPLISDSEGNELVMAEIMWPVYSQGGDTRPQPYGHLVPHKKEDATVIGGVYEAPNIGKIRVERKLPEGGYMFLKVSPEEEGVASAQNTFGKILGKADSGHNR